MGLHVTKKFGQIEYMKCLFLLLLRYGKNTGIVVDKGHMQSLPSTWVEELQAVDLGQWWELRRHPQPDAVMMVRQITKIGLHELFMVLWLLLSHPDNKNRAKFRKRELRNVPANWMGMVEIREAPDSWLITVKREAKDGIIIDPTSVIM